MSKQKKNRRRKSKTLNSSLHPSTLKKNSVTGARPAEVKQASSTPSSIESRNDFGGSLFDRARTQWQFGDWESLTRIEPEALELISSREELALLAAAGHFQMGNISTAMELTEQSKAWGCSQALISRILIAGVYNNLGQIATIGEQPERAGKYFEESLQIGMPGTDINLLKEARISSQTDISAKVVASGSVIAPSVSPRIILVSGMIRSGSTAVLNIIIDLLKANRKALIKYYITDLKNITTFRDHVIQNPGVTFILKTHEVDVKLLDLFSEFPVGIVHTKRNIYEVAASYIRMTKNQSSPFYRKGGVTLDALLMDLKAQLISTKQVQSIDSALVVDAQDLAKDNITPAVSNINQLLGLDSTPNLLGQIARKHNRKNSAKLTTQLVPTEFTSLGHDKNTFYHKDHVLESGTEVEKFLNPEWKEAIKRDLGSFFETR